MYAIIWLKTVVISSIFFVKTCKANALKSTVLSFMLTETRCGIRILHRARVAKRSRITTMIYVSAMHNVVLLLIIMTY